MMFLGVSVALAMENHSCSKKLFAVLLGPSVLVAGSVAGSVLASTLQSSITAHLGLLSFGAAALLYLVTEELLLEAHESTDGHVWYVDLCFFVGFLLSVVLAKLAT